MWGYEDAFGMTLAYLHVTVLLDSLFEVPKVCWDPVDQAEEYQVVRAGNLSLPHCATRFLSDPCWQDPTIPRPGEVLQYLARPSRPFAGDWGFDSEGHDRFITCSDCPPEPGGPLVLDSCLECPEQRESCEHIRGKALADVACPVVSYQQPRYCKDDPYCNGMCDCTLTWDDPECDWASGQMCVSSSEMQSRCFRDFCPRVQDTLQYLSVALINGRAWFLNLDNDATYQCDLVQDCTLDQFDCIGDAAAGQTVPVWSHSPFPPNPVCATDVIRIDTDNVPDSSPCQTGECSYDCTVVIN